MKDGKPSNVGDPEGRRSPGGRRASAPANQKGFVERATARGHSGHGAESVRPHLRDQLRLKALLPTPFPTPDDQPSKDEHHR
ncbi:hypothetical protein GCM10028796_17740 [Ramlibacter monticola]|uniref:Uncharacterized protein n=1 Tax=Ramlibacter monticola TaxID=1926872 RepID=A0A937CR00_9BURK|nr:hypothetical protein [Ramlibacter monticola]MBL0390600.1 hypothetical protein [Ramlibacter monticola]